MTIAVFPALALVGCFRGARGASPEQAFRDLLADPVPGSVRGLRAHAWSDAGSSGVALAFEIDPADCALLLAKADLAPPILPGVPGVVMPPPNVFRALDPEGILEMQEYLHGILPAGPAEHKEVYVKPDRTRVYFLFVRRAGHAGG